MNIAALCNFEAAKYLIFSSNVPVFVYYTHISALVLTFILGVFVLLKGKKELPNRVLFFTLVPFWIWIAFNVVIWASNRSDLIMFLWSIQVLIEPLIYAGMLYLVYVTVNKKDSPLSRKLIWGLLFLPMIFIAPTRYNLPGFDLDICIPIESFYAYWTYVIELIYTAWLAIFAIKKYRESKDKNEKGQILYLSTGAVLFLLAFASGNIIGSFTDNWNLAQIGLFGVPIFTGLIVYSIVKYKTFNLSLVGSIVLVIGLCVVTLSQMFVRDPSIYPIIASITFLFSLVMGYSLIRFIRQDLKNQERIQQLSQLKDEFLGLASHQLRTPVSIIRGNIEFFEETPLKNLTEKDYNEIVRILKTGSLKLSNIITDILSAARMDALDFKLKKEETKNIDLVSIVEDIVFTNKSLADDKKISLEFKSRPTRSPIVRSQPTFLEQAISIIVSNAISYTKQGKVEVSVLNKENQCIIEIRDTGIGIRERDKKSIFEKFKRGSNAVDAYAYGSGLGLFMAKKIIDAHGAGARIWFDSEEGKGTTFYISLPTVDAPNKEDVWVKKLNSKNIVE